MAASFFCIFFWAVALLSSSHFLLLVDSADPDLIEKLCQQIPHDGQFYQDSCANCLKGNPNIHETVAQDLPGLLIGCAISAASAERGEAASLIKNLPDPSMKEKLKGCAADFNVAYNDVSISSKAFAKKDYSHAVLNLNNAQGKGFTSCVARFGAVQKVPRTMLQHMRMLSDMCIDSVGMIKFLFNPPPASPRRNLNEETSLLPSKH